jgi:hypothetical protein
MAKSDFYPFSILEICPINIMKIHFYLSRYPFRYSHGDIFFPIIFNSLFLRPYFRSPFSDSDLLFLIVHISLGEQRARTEARLAQEGRSVTGATFACRPQGEGRPRAKGVTAAHSLFDPFVMRILVWSRYMGYTFVWVHR